MDSIIILAREDNVAVATQAVAKGSAVTPGVQALSDIPAGHKVALRPIAKGEPVIKFGSCIGEALVDIAPGMHVHSAELGFGSGRGGAADQGTGYRPAPPKRTMFEGFRRPSGKVGTRNFIGIAASVNCSATVCRRIADEANRTLLPKYPGVDGFVPLVHGQGCGTAAVGEGADILRRTISGYLGNPNFASCLLIGLGCEVNQVALYLQAGKGAEVTSYNIQDVGGSRSAVMRALELLEPMAAKANDVKRETVPVSELIVGLQCGGSDGLSGVTANPALGVAVDLLVAAGGAAILSETPEIFGAEHLLTARAKPEVAEKLEARIRWWQAYVAGTGASLDNNPSPGNKRGGLTTILEKSLGAVAKGGRTDLVEVVEYAERVRAKGLIYMDTPGYDPVSATGQVAGGANLVVFTTGRGSCFGCRPSPSIKVSTNSDLYRRMSEDMDIDAGRIVTGQATVESVGLEIYERMLDVASGQHTVSEDFGYGDDEFVPWHIGAVL